MSTPAIRIRDLAKAYRIGVAEKVPDTLMSAIKGAFVKPWQNFHRLRNLDTASAKESEDEQDTIWALRDISFDVERGDVIGIVGRNGAGKSTLLKILSRITDPTHGSVEIRGRISSLLEVGTGFHPDLTGRENIYMNGTIHGMTKHEIDQRFDDIVDFSGVSRFLDTPCKRYSSGMKVRLAFSVAAHLEPEIMIIDEVLAVGDTEFQKKCMDKMESVAKSGRTVVFVSHNLSALQSLCSKSVLLKAGELVAVDKTEEVVKHYLAEINQMSSQKRLLSAPDNDVPTWIRSVEIRSDDDGEILKVGANASCFVGVNNAHDDMCCIVTVYDVFGSPIATFDSSIGTLDADRNGTNSEGYRCTFPLYLRPGRYRLGAGLKSRGRWLHRVDDAISFKVFEGDLMVGIRRASKYGSVVFPNSWVGPASPRTAE